MAKIIPYADFLKLNHKLLSIKVLPTINVLLPTAEKKVSGNLSSERKESTQLCCQYVKVGGLLQKVHPSQILHLTIEY